MYLQEPKSDKFSSQNETTNKNDQSNKISNYRQVFKSVHILSLLVKRSEKLYLKKS